MTPFKAFRIHERDGKIVAGFEQVALDALTPGEVVIRVQYSSINYKDALAATGAGKILRKYPLNGGIDLAGEVVSSDDARYRAGQPVLVTGCGHSETLDGGYAEFALADEGSCLPVPRGVTLEEAAGLPETVFTVWANAFDDAALKPGETLLVHGGTSGIGVTAIMLAKAWGARVIATASSDDKLKAILDLGADAAFNYATSKWEDEIVRLGGADVVLDMTGGDFVARNLEALNFRGRHVSIAFLRGAAAEINSAAPICVTTGGATSAPPP